MLLLAFPALENSLSCLGSGDWPLGPHELLVHPQDLYRLRIPAFGYVAIHSRSSSSSTSTSTSGESQSGGIGSSGPRHACPAVCSTDISGGHEETARELVSFCRAIPDDSLTPGETRAPSWLLRAAGVSPRQYLSVCRAPQAEKEGETATSAPALGRGGQQEKVGRFRVNLSIVSCKEDRLYDKSGGGGGHPAATIHTSAVRNRAIARRVTGCMVRVGSLLAAEILGETVISRVISILDRDDINGKSNTGGDDDDGVSSSTSRHILISSSTEIVLAETNEISSADNYFVPWNTPTLSLQPPEGEQSSGPMKEMQQHGGGDRLCKETEKIWARQAPGMEAVLSELYALVRLCVGDTAAQYSGCGSDMGKDSTLRWSEVLPAGILLCGPSGIGKTFALGVLADNLCENHAVHVIRLLGPQILASMAQGGGDTGGISSGTTEGSAINKVLQGPLGRFLEEARSRAPSVLMLDELDALFDAHDAGVSGGTGGESVAQLLGERARANVALLDMLDCASKIEGVAVVGATRRLPGGRGGAGWAGLEEGDGGDGSDRANVPAAYRKPGRFDRCVVVDPPTQAQRERILRVILSSSAGARDWVLEPLEVEPDPVQLVGADFPASETTRRAYPLDNTPGRGVGKPGGVIEDRNVLENERYGGLQLRTGDHVEARVDRAAERRKSKQSLDIIERRRKGSVEATTAESVLAEWAKRLSSVTPGMVGGDLERLVRVARARSAQRKLLKNTEGRVAGEIACLPPPQQQAPPNVLMWQDALGAVAVTVPRSLKGLDVASSNSGGGGPTWASVGGFSEAKRRLQRLVQWPWLHPEAFARMGVSAPAGALLYGPSGCGKSLMAQVLATECLANFVWVRSSELLSRYLGETEAKLRALFSRARAAAPCILFLDELDAITAKRGDGGGDGGEETASGSVHARVLSTLLNEMDGVASASSASAARGGGGVLVLAATNRRNALDAALLRPGRLHESVELGEPNKEDREGVLRVHAARLPLAPDVDLAMLSRDDVSGGLTCADLEACCRDAAMMALREDLHGAREVRPEHLKKALEDRMAGRLRTRKFTFSVGQGPSSGPAPGAM